MWPLPMQTDKYNDLNISESVYKINKIVFFTDDLHFIKFNLFLKI